MKLSHLISYFHIFIDVRRFLNLSTNKILHLNLQFVIRKKIFLSGAANFEITSIRLFISLNFDDASSTQPVDKTRLDFKSALKVPAENIVFPSPYLYNHKLSRISSHHRSHGSPRLVCFSAAAGAGAQFQVQTETDYSK